MQSGHTHFPARSKLCRMFGSSMHQQWSLPGGAPQLNLVPHSSQVSFSMPTFLADVEKMLRQVTENRKPVCYSFQTRLGTQANSLSKSGDAVLILGQREHGGIGRHTRLKILRSYDRGGSSPPARTTSQQIVQPREQMLCDCPLNLSSSPGQ